MRIRAKSLTLQTRIINHKRIVVSTAAAAAVALLVGRAGADVMLGQDWTPVSNPNGYTYFDGFVDYADGAGNTQLSQVNQNGNFWLQYVNANGQWWGQLVAQSWAAPSITTTNLNANPRLEFDIDLSQYTWGRLFVNVDFQDDDGSGGNSESGSAHFDLSQLIAKNKATLTDVPNPFVEHVSLDLSSLTPRNPANTSATLSLYLQPNYWGYWDPDTQQFVGGTYTAQTLLIDNLGFMAGPAKTNAAWNVNADGNWRTGLTDGGTVTWAGGIPNGAGHTANFLQTTDYDTGQNTIEARTVTVDGPLTTGVINFHNTGGYTISGPGTITLEGVTGVAPAINTANGNHTIASPLVLAGDTTVTVRQAPNTLTVSSLQPTASALTKQGPGTLVVNTVRAGALNVNEGAVRLLANGSDASTARVGALAIAGGATPTATLDLNDNDLIVTAGDKATIQTQIQHARHSGAWDQAGITSLAAKDNIAHNTTIGVLSGAEFKSMNGASATFGGFAVADTDVLAKYTYYGDTDFNGRVNFDDYVRTDNGFNNHQVGWMNGDFDGNNTVNFDDYVLIDLAYNTQSGTLGRALSFLDGSNTSGAGMDDPALRTVRDHLAQFGGDYAGHFLSAVPEPSMMSLSAIAAAGALARRRRGA